MAHDQNQKCILCNISFKLWYKAYGTVYFKLYVDSSHKSFECLEICMFFNPANKLNFPYRVQQTYVLPLNVLSRVKINALFVVK